MFSALTQQLLSSAALRVHVRADPICDDCDCARPSPDWTQKCTAPPVAKGGVKNTNSKGVGDKACWGCPLAEHRANNCNNITKHILNLEPALHLVQHPLNFVEPCVDVKVLRKLRTSRAPDGQGSPQHLQGAIHDNIGNGLTPFTPRT